MTPFIIGNIQFTFSLLVYALIAVWYVYPKLKQKEWNKALVPLLLIHCFRFAPLTLLMPGQVSTDVPLNIIETIVLGDLISSVLAILAAIFVWYKFKAAKLMVWLFTIVGIGDVIVVSVKAIGAGLLDMPLGFNLYILNFYVPMLIVTHIIIILFLKKNKFPIYN